MEFSGKCAYCNQPAMLRPVMVVPILNDHRPAYLAMREGLCGAHRVVFTLKHFTDYYGSWYDMVRADIENRTKLVEVQEPVVVAEPRPETAGFAVLEMRGTKVMRRINAGYKVAPMEECRLVFWPVLAKGPKPAKLFPDGRI